MNLISTVSIKYYQYEGGEARRNL